MSRISAQDLDRRRQARQERQSSARKRAEPDSVSPSPRPAKRQRSSEGVERASSQRTPNIQTGHERRNEGHNARSQQPRDVMEEAVAPPIAPPPASLSGGGSAGHVVDLTADNDESIPSNYSLQREADDDDVVLLSESRRPGMHGSGTGPQVVHFRSGTNGTMIPMIMLDLLMNGPLFNRQPERPPPDLSGGYWAKRRAASQLVPCATEMSEEGKPKKIEDKEEAEMAEKSKASFDGTLPGKDCPVCLSHISDITSAACGHVFCEGCILQAIHHQGRCPQCRRKLTEKDIHPLFI